MAKAIPANESDNNDGEVSAKHIIVAPAWADPLTGATYVHHELVPMAGPWENEAHIGPAKDSRVLGDIPSFVAYVKRYGVEETTLLTWTDRGLGAVLDYHDVAGIDGEAVRAIPGRAQWTARYDFQHSLEWLAWMNIAHGNAIAQKRAVELIEDRVAEVVKPDAIELLNILRALRMTINSKAESMLRPDGTTKVTFEKNTEVQNLSSVDLPPEFQIAIPVLKGHVDANGAKVTYKMAVRLRTTDVDGKLHLRFTVPLADQILAEVIEERVATAKALLGGDYPLYRGA